jgi:hypothetical protein
VPGLQTKIYECLVTGVLPNDRVLHAKSRNGTRFQNVSYLLPYISARGGGLDCVPEEGDKCLILAADPGPAHRGRFYVCIGFQAHSSPGSDGLELGRRIKNLPPGSTAIRAVSEDGGDARVVCFKGGTVLIASGEVCQTLYSPIDNAIMHMFNNWEMQGPGGFVRWTRESDSDAVVYESEYRVGVDGGMRARVEIGADDAEPVRVQVLMSADDPLPPLTLTVNSQGQVTMTVNDLAIEGYAQVSIDAPSVLIKGRRVLDQKDPI